MENHVVANKAPCITKLDTLKSRRVVIARLVDNPWRHLTLARFR